MKRKFSSMGRVAIALVLALSLSLVMAVPVAADSPADTDVGFLFGVETEGEGSVVWESGEANVDTGNYSVKLDNGGVSSYHPYVEFIPEPGTTMSDLATIGTTGFRCKSSSTLVEPNMELRFTAPDFDPDLKGQQPHRGHADVNITNNNPSEAWETEDATASSIVYTYWNDPTDGTGANNDGTPTTLALTLGVINDSDEMKAADPDDTADDWELTRVRIELSETNVGVVYIDDITIDGTTYELEPIFLDAEFYSVGDTVEVTVPNFAANTDSFRINPVADEIQTTPVDDNWTISVTTTSDDTAIIFALEETGANTGVFTGSFTTTTTIPVAEDEVYVEDGDDIIVTYLTSDDDWGTGTESTTSITASVDDSAPTINNLTPEDGEQISDRTPDISADYDEVPTTSVELIFDGVDVTDDATVGNTSVSYTPEDELDDGTYSVTVNIEDAAGNPATKTWSFRVVSWLVDPEGPSVSPLDALATVGVAVSITGADAALITVGHYASNPEPDALLTFDEIENGFFDVKVTGAEAASQVVIKFADANITAESTAYVWSELEGIWLACDDQGYNATDEFLWVLVRTDTTPNIAELDGTPFAISGEEAVTLESIAAEPESVTLDVDGTQQLIVTAAYSDLSELDVTAEADYESSDNLVATVSAAGLITAVAEGSATVTVTYETETALVSVTAEPTDILAYYRAYSGDANVVDTLDLLKAADDWSADITPPDFPEPITTMQLLQLADEWVATE